VQEASEYVPGALAPQSWMGHTQFVPLQSHRSVVFWYESWPHAMQRSSVEQEALPVQALPPITAVGSGQPVSADASM